MVETVCVVGAGRVGSALAARLAERGVAVRSTGRDLELGPVEVVLLCVPDRAIGDVAARIGPGPWLAHVSGASRLSALDPHTRRFSLHPLQTFVHGAGGGQLDGAFAAVSAETDEARQLGLELATLLGLLAFELADEERALYHAGAAIASNYLVTLERAASELLDAAGAPPGALVPLMRRTIENGFELTGPIERGDWATVDAHLRAIRGRRPQLERMYRVLAETTAAIPR